MAWILRNSGNGYAYEAMERVVAKKNTNVYLEAMEKAENKGSKPEEIGYARMAGLSYSIVWFSAHNFIIRAGGEQVDDCIE